MPKRNMLPTESPPVEGAADAVDTEDVVALREALEQEQKTAEEYLHRLRYLQADFENYKRRVTREIADATARGNQKLITELLTVLDELEYAITAGKTSNNKDALLHGVEITLKKLYSLLEKEGLAKIEAVGQAFDPHTHQAVQRVSGDSDGERVVEEIRAGFTLHGKVIRPSLVKIAYPVPPDSNGSTSGDTYE